jgi:tRNA nucleotidyltransferase (CCA-adding enzyme)
MAQTINSVLKEVLEKVHPSSEDMDLIESALKKFLIDFGKSLKKLKIDAEIFVGGSYAKKTMIKKDNYDIDIFVRFKSGADISKLTEKALKKFGAKVVHGSRDYFQVTITKDIFFEIIPVVKVSNPKDAENITDLSYSHVKYMNKKVKTERILNEIKLAKVFCYANKCYGAESYIKGFSGYSLELLVYHYGGFLKFVRDMAKTGHPRVYPREGQDPETVSDETSTRGKLVIDIEKQYPNKSHIMMDVNTSKLKSPIILIDPTYKQRNVAAALSEETFAKFQKVCGAFLKNPSMRFFELQEIDFGKVEEAAKKNHLKFIALEIKTNRQAGDIAGSKLLKFHKHLQEEIGKFFEIKKKGFEYSDGKIAKSFFVLKNRGEILYDGPNVRDAKNVKKFKKEHAKTFVKKNRLYAKKKINFGVEEFLKKWKVKNNRRMKEMAIVGFEKRK